MNDLKILKELNERFIDAFRKGSWETLRPILSPDFSFLDGATGEVWHMERYIGDLDGKPVPTIRIDQLRIHIDGNTAVVSSRSSARPGRSSRYLDTYERREDVWLCVHACVWPLQSAPRS